MSTLEDINNKLKEANEGNTEYADLQQDFQIRQLSLLEGINTSMNKLISGEVEMDVNVETPLLVDPKGDPKDEEGENTSEGENEEEEKQTGLLKNMLGFLKDLSVTAKEQAETAKAAALKAARSSSVVKGFKDGSEKNDPITFVKDKMKMPFMMQTAQIKAALEFFGNAIGTLFSVIRRVFSPATVAVVAIADGIMTAYKAFTSEEGTFGEKLLAGVNGLVEGIFHGIGLVTDWIVGIVAKVTRFFGFGDAADALEQTVKDESMADKFARWARELTEKLNNLGRALGGWLFDTVESIKGIFKSIGDWFTETKNSITETFDNAWEKVKSVALDAINFFKNIFDTIKTTFDSVVDWFGETWNAAKETIDEVWEGIKTVASTVWDTITGLFTGIQNIFTTAKEWVTESWDTAKETVDNAWESVKERFQNIVDKITGIFDTIKNIFFNAVETLTFALSWEGVKSTIDTALDQMGKIGEWIGDLAKQAWGWVKSKLMFWKKDAEAETLAVSGTESVEDLEKSGAVKKEGVYGMRDVVIEPSVISNMSDQQLVDVAKKYPKEKKLQKQVMEEQKVRAQKSASPERAEEAKEVLNSIVSTYAPEIETIESSTTPIETGVTEKVGTGTVVQALNSAPEIPVIVAGPVTPTPASGNISGLGYESVGQTGTMQVAQQSLYENKSRTEYVTRNNATNVANVDNSSSVVNNSVINSPMPSAMDASDRGLTTPSYLIFR